MKVIAENTWKGPWDPPIQLALVLDQKREARFDSNRYANVTIRALQDIGGKELVSRDFTWERWREDVAEYVASCLKCQKSKSDRHSRQNKINSHAYWR